VKRFIILFFFPLFLFPQTNKHYYSTDSLLNEAVLLYASGKYTAVIQTYEKLLQKSDVNRAKILYKIFYAYLAATDEDNALKYLNKADSLVQKFPTVENKMLRYYHHAVYSDSKHQYTKAVNDLIKTEELAFQVNDTFQQQLDNLLMGKIFLKQKNYHKAKKYLDQSLKLAQTINDSVLIANSTFYLANWYFDQQKNQQAEKLINKALSLYTNKQHLKGQILCKGYLSQLYIRRGNIPKAIELSYETADLMKQMQLSGKTQKLLHNLEQQVKISKDSLQTDSLKIDESLNVFKKSVQLTREQDAILNISKSSDEIIKQDPEMRLPETKYVRKLVLQINDSVSRLKDSIWQQRLNSKYAEIEAKYQSEKKEKENLILKAEKAEQAIALEKENKRKWFFAIGMIFSLLLLILFAYFYRRNKKQKSLIESLQKDLHHRVKNNLTIIDSLVEDIKDEVDSPEILNRLTDLQNRIDSINEVHRQLYAGEHLTELNLKKYVEKLANAIRQSFANEHITIENQIAENLTIPVEKSFPVGLIINEFITNSFKYAFDKDKQGLIRIELMEKAKSYLLLLADNGKGLPDDLDLNRLNSFGMNIMKLLSKQLGGQFSITERKKGLHIIIQFPK